MVLDSLIDELEKIAEHADDRLRERTNLPPEAAHELRAIASELTPPPGSYYAPIHKGGRHVATAAFRTVGRRNKLVLTTVLSPHMTPQGASLGHVEVAR